MFKYLQMSILCLRVFKPPVRFAVGKGHRSKNEMTAILACFQMLSTTEEAESRLYLPS